ncbi:MAG TPA: alcohol dehydrogenase, partial [Chloroflexi bacterium]|nr:alcohol dehydrogenase [Chloroflexota bacterium]
CHRCAPCRRGDVTHCANRTVLGIVNRDGAHADYLVLPTENLHPVPDPVPDEKAVFTEPLAAACEILEQVQIHPTDRVAVIGDGKLGLLCAQVLALTGAEVHAIGRHEEKLDVLRRRGISVEAVRQGEASQKPAGWADVVVEATGNSEGFISARGLVRPRGSLVLKSTYHGTLDVNLSLLVVDEITLVGSRCGPFTPALRLLAGDVVDVTSLIQDRFSLSEADRAMARAVKPGVLKVLLEAV